MFVTTLDARRVRMLASVKAADEVVHVTGPSAAKRLTERVMDGLGEAVREPGSTALSALPPRGAVRTISRQGRNVADTAGREARELLERASVPDASATLTVDALTTARSYSRGLSETARSPLVREAGLSSSYAGRATRLEQRAHQLVRTKVSQARDLLSDTRAMTSGSTSRLERELFPRRLESAASTLRALARTEAALPHEVISLRKMADKLESAVRALKRPGATEAGLTPAAMRALGKRSTAAETLADDLTASRRNFDSFVRGLDKLRAGAEDLAKAASNGTNTQRRTLETSATSLNLKATRAIHARAGAIEAEITAAARNLEGSPADAAQAAADLTRHASQLEQLADYAPTAARAKQLRHRAAAVRQSVPQA